VGDRVCAGRVGVRIIGQRHDGLAVAELVLDLGDGAFCPSDGAFCPSDGADHDDGVDDPTRELR